MDISVQNGGIVEAIGDEKAYEAIARAGFKAIDWNIDHGLDTAAFKKKKYSGVSIFEKDLPEIQAYYAEELALIRKNGLRITQLHAPFPAYLSKEPESLDYSVKILANVIKFCGTLGEKVNLIVHGISLAYNNHDETPEEISKLNDKLYLSLIPALKENENVTVCLENLFTSAGGYNEGHCSDPHNAAKYIDFLNEQAGAERFGLCLDTGHLNLLRKDFRVYCPILGKRIKALHIHDNSQSGDDHLMPYAGNIDWDNFVSSLKAIGYEGDLSFETFRQIRVLKGNVSLIDPFLKLIYEIGENFRSGILG